MLLYHHLPLVYCWIVMYTTIKESVSKFSSQTTKASSPPLCAALQHLRWTNTTIFELSLAPDCYLRTPQSHYQCALGIYKRHSVFARRYITIQPSFHCVPSIKGWPSPCTSPLKTNDCFFLFKPSTFNPCSARACHIPTPSSFTQQKPSIQELYQPQTQHFMKPQPLLFSNFIPQSTFTLGSSFNYDSLSDSVQAFNC